MGESKASEETVSGGQEEGGDSPESSQALVSSPPPGCVGHPRRRPEIPSPPAPEEGSAGHCQSSGTVVSVEFGPHDFSTRKGIFVRCVLKQSVFFFLLSLQALWRGHRSRRLNDNPKVVKLRHQLRKISASVREEDKLCNKTSSALDYLLRYKHFSYILEALKNLGKASLSV